VIANWIFVDPEVLMDEINFLENQGFSLKNKLLISYRCHLIIPYHKALDKAYENARGKNRLGTTRRGGPTYADKVAYHGIRFYELVDWKVFEKNLFFN